MRDDMSKVLVEEPRSGRSMARALAGSRRAARHQLDPDGEGGRSRLGMREDRCKHFGEHLGPLRRYLRKQVNRPWDKVYGELCAALDRRSVVQAHIFQHIGGYVEMDTVLHEGEVWARSWRGLVPLAQSWREMYVHPRTRLLLLNKARPRAMAERRRERTRQQLAAEADRRIGIPGLPAGTQWHRIDGIWWEVAVAPVPRDHESKVFDVLLRKAVSLHVAEAERSRYGPGNLYAVTKRQLDRRTLRHHGLASA